jgi:hypothetical protein
LKLIRLRMPRLALRSWVQLAASVEQQIGERIVPRCLFLARADYEALRGACFATEPEWAREFFASRMGRFRRAPYVAPILPRGTALYEAQK